MWDGRGKAFHYASFQDGTLVRRDSTAACMFVNEVKEQAADSMGGAAGEWEHQSANGGKGKSE